MQVTSLAHSGAPEMAALTCFAEAEVSGASRSRSREEGVRGARAECEGTGRQ